MKFNLNEISWLQWGLRNLIDDAKDPSSPVIMTERQIDEVYGLSNKLYGLTYEEIIAKEKEDKNGK